MKSRFDRAGGWGNTWLWSQPEDHPQRLLVQPGWRRRMWAKRKTERHAKLDDMVKSAPRVFAKNFFHGLLKGPVTL